MTEVETTTNQVETTDNDTFTIQKCRQIPADELALINAAIRKAEDAKDSAARAVELAERSELELKNTVQRIFLVHMILPSCSVDKETGVVTWPNGV